MGFLEKVFGNINTKELKKIDKLVDQVISFEKEIEKLTDDELKGKTSYFKEKIKEGSSLDDLLPEAYAVVREAAWRVLEMKHFRVQVIGGIVLHQGRISEMKTGEGKTLVATLPVYLNALSGKGVHVVTVNDYLAKRDMEWMAKVYKFLGLSVGCIIHGITNEARKAAYNMDITYGTNNEFGFDYLRDNMVIYKQDMAQRQLNYAIVDEVDSILVDEARTPLIISGAGEKSTHLYMDADKFVKKYKNEVDFTIDEKANTVVLTEDGVSKAERYFKIENFADPENMQLNHHINQALKANTLMKKDTDYVVNEGEIVIVDEFTGRLMLGRRYSEGLHQAIEAKEGLKVQRESKTLATITLQNYFRMYNKLAGMTGTAKTEEDEFKEIYNMDVIEIPTNKSIARKDMADSIYGTEKGKYKAIVNQIIERHRLGQPMLVGTISIENSELISEMLKKQGIKHNVLNAKQHEKEAQIVAEAGRYNAVTIATNMAGRGTDIVLGGNIDFEVKKEMKRKGYDELITVQINNDAKIEDPEWVKAKEDYEQIFKEVESLQKEEQKKVIEAGGLHIIGTERHESRRIDNQLRGRAGRQGDAGSSQFYISLEDDLMRLFGGDRIKSFVDKFGVQEDEAIEAGLLTKSIENAQKKVEGRNFSIRKYVLQYDDVMNKQREVIYNERRSVLEGENLRTHIFAMLDMTIHGWVESYTAEAKYPEEWDLKGLEDYLHTIFLPIGSLEFDDLEDMTRADLESRIMKIAEDLYSQKELEIGEERMRDLERMLLLKIVDTKWMDHIDAMDQLKQGIGLRAYGHEDPVRAYQNEGFEMFEAMIKSIQEDTLKYAFHVTVQTETKREAVVEVGKANKSDADQLLEENRKIATNRGADAKKKEPVRKEVTIGRNDPCPCGSGKKYKKCCGMNEKDDQ